MYELIELWINQATSLSVGQSLLLISACMLLFVLVVIQKDEL